MPQLIFDPHFYKSGSAPVLQHGKVTSRSCLVVFLALMKTSERITDTYNHHKDRHKAE